jgi:hypothetical protein
MRALAEFRTLAVFSLSGRPPVSAKAAMAAMAALAESE